MTDVIDRPDEIPGPPASPRPRLAYGDLGRFAYERLEDLLNAGRLPPGHVVSQRELVAMTGATLGSVREAVARLEAEGLLQAVARKGIMVPALDVAFVRDAYGVRRMIERTALPDVLARLPPARLDAIVARHESLLDDLPRDAEAPPALVDRIQRTDWETHQAFVACAGNALLDNIYRVTAVKIRMVVQGRLRVTAGNARRVLLEHLGILAAVRAGDLAAAEAALMRHIDKSLGIALGLDRGD